MDKILIDNIISQLLLSEEGKEYQVKLMEGTSAEVENLRMQIGKRRNLIPEIRRSYIQITRKKKEEGLYSLYVKKLAEEPSRGFTLECSDGSSKPLKTLEEVRLDKMMSEENNSMDIDPWKEGEEK